VSIITPFLELMTNEDGLRSKWYISWLYSLDSNISSRQILIFLSVTFIVIYFVKNAFMIYSSYVQTVFAADFNMVNSTRMLKSYLKRPYQFFVNTNSNVILRGINNDVGGVYSILLNIFTILNECVKIVMIGIFLLITDWMITLCSLSLAIVCFVFIVTVFKRRIKVAGKEMRRATADKTKVSYEAINGIKEISVMDRREMFVSRFRKCSEVEKKSKVTDGVLSSSPDRIIEAVCMGGFMLIVCFKVMSDDNFEVFIPVIGTFAIGAFKILPSFSKISSRINNVVYYIECIKNCYDMFIEADALEVKEQKRIDEVKEKIELRDIKFREVLSLQNITWKYDTAKGAVIRNLSLDIHRGESVAFIGASGAGKTTVSDIILGLYEPQEGSVTIDGIDIYSIPHEWSHIIGYVPQAVYMIDDSIRRNVAFGLPDEEIDDNKVWEALDKAQLKEFTESLPNGLDTILGERGVKFSGGQRQRVAIARALYEDPDILVLDEATSALDGDTEDAVMEAIEALQGVKTLIIVAHRLSTIRNCDKIYEIGEGVATLRDKREVLA